MWNLQTNQQQQVAQHAAAVRHCFYVRQLNMLVTGSWDKTVKYWDLRSPTPAHTQQMPERVYAMDVQSELLVVGTADRQIQVGQGGMGQGAGAEGKGGRGRAGAGWAEEDSVAVASRCCRGEQVEASLLTSLPLPPPLSPTLPPPAVGMEISVPLFFGKLKVILGAMALLIAGKVAVMTAVGQAFGLTLVQSMRRYVRCTLEERGGGGRCESGLAAATCCVDEMSGMQRFPPFPHTPPHPPTLSPPAAAWCCPPVASLRLCCLAKR